MIPVIFRFLFLLGAVSAAAFAQPRPLEGNPGNVFVKGQEVTVKVPVGEGEKWVCVDYDGKTVAEGMGASVSLGKADIGYYEIWKLGADGKRSDRTTIGVLAPLEVSVPDDTPIALDTAAAWFYRDQSKPFGLKQAANLSALAGVKWVRDRLGWAETEPEKGKFAGESIYDKSAEAFSAEGLKVLQVFHDTPRWAGERPKFYPDDLRDAYGYLKTMSARWKGKVHAWEPWNEGDTTNFGGHTGEQMMAYQRAAYHGVRAGNPDAIVCLNVFAEHQKTGVISNFIENLDSKTTGSARYPFDTFNFHHYVQPGAIPTAYEAMRDASGGKPMWVTESYFHFRQGVKSGDLDMSVDQRKLRARFVTTNLVTALNENPATFFTFVLPHYVEAGVLFGLLNADGTPRPDYLALAAAGRLLAGAGAAGKMNVEFPAYAFRAVPDGKEKVVLVAWAEKEQAIPDAWRGYEKAYDFLGREVKLEKIGIDPIYLVFPDGALGLTPPVVRRLPDVEQASPLVIQTVFPHGRLRLASSSWEVKQGEKLKVPVRLYHFGAGKVDVSLEAEADPAIKVSLSGGSFSIDPEGRVDAWLEIGWSGTTVPARPMPVKLTVKAPGVSPCVSVVRISTQMGDVVPKNRWPLAGANNAVNWKPGSSAGDLKLGGEGAFEVIADLKPGDRWVYPWCPLKPDERPAKEAKGIAFTLTPREGAATYHAMVREPGGSLYVASLGQLQGDGKARRVVALFDDFSWAGYSPTDANHRLDAEAVEAFTIGGNPKDAKFGYRVENVEWVDFAE